MKDSGEMIPQVLLSGLLATYAPKRIWLFGSHARGEAGPDSDIDLLVELDDTVAPEMLKWRKQSEARRAYHGPVDIIACRASLLAKRARVPSSIAETIMLEGIVIYERP